MTLRINSLQLNVVVGNKVQFNIIIVLSIEIPNDKITAIRLIRINGKTSFIYNFSHQ